MLDRPTISSASIPPRLPRSAASAASARWRWPTCLQAEGRSAPIPLAPKPPHFPPKAKNVIFLFQEGAPSQMDLFDPKPMLQKYNGQSLPPEMTEHLQLAFIKKNAQVLASQAAFRKCGESGMEISDMLPHTQGVADEICLIRSMFSEAFNHHPGQSLLMTGSPLLGRPTIGSWLTYGLGSESGNLPGFVVLSSGRGTSGGSSNWSSGFLPSTYAGVPFRSSGDPILYLSNPDGVDSEDAAHEPGRDPRPQPGAARQDRRPRDRFPHPELRAGVPHAGGRAGAAGLLRRAAAHPRQLRRGQRADASLRGELPIGPPDGGARRALRDAGARELGPAPEPQEATSRRTATSPTSRPQR